MGWTRRKFEYLSMKTVDSNAEKYAREMHHKMVRYIVAEVAGECPYCNISSRDAKGVWFEFE